MKKTLPGSRLHGIALFAALALSACSGGGGGGGSSSGATVEKVQLSGSVSKASGAYNYKMAETRSTYQRVLAFLGFGSPAFADGSDPAVDQVVAIPMFSGSLNTWGMENHKTAAISANGNFSLSLEKDRDWLLMLVNSSATGTSRFVGSLAFDAGSSNSLLNLPATETTLSTMSLGTVSRPTSTSNDAITTRVVGTADFSLSAAQLMTMAKTDKLFRNAMNIVNNFGNFGNGPAIWYYARPDFTFLGDFSSLTTTFSSPSLTYRGMSFQLDTNSTAVAMSSICSGTVSLAFVPPAAISYSGNNYSPSSPITNTGAVCQTVNSGQQAAGTNFYATSQYAGKISYSFPGELQTNPPGYWLWKENGATKAAFDVSSITPPITASGRLRGFVPSLKITVNGSNRITWVDIQWYYYDEALDTYTVLAQADLTLLKHFIGGFEVKFDRTYNSVRRTEEIYVDPSTTTRVTPTMEWYIVPHAADPLMETGLMGFFESGGFGHFFHFFNTNMTP